MKIIVKSLKPLLKVFFFFFFCNSGDLSLICTQLKCHPPSFQSSPTFYLAGCSRQWSKISPTILHVNLLDGSGNYLRLNAFLSLPGSYVIIPCLLMPFFASSWYYSLSHWLYIEGWSETIMNIELLISQVS